MTPPDGVLRGLRLGSILIGVVVDKLAAFASIGLLLALLGSASTTFQVAALVAGASCTTLGSFVAAWHAGRRHLGHGVAVGVIALLISVSRFVLTRVLATSGSSASHSTAWELAAWASVIAAGVLGGALASRVRSTRAA